MGLRFGSWFCLLCFKSKLIWGEAQKPQSLANLDRLGRPSYRMKSLNKVG
jgi:hypothetical protein